MTNTILALHDPKMARRYYADGLWRSDTLYTLLRDHADKRPKAFAVRDARRRLSWSELRTLVDAVAADLDAAGVKRGERVAVWLPNRIEAVAIFLACSRNGYVCNPSLHRNYTVGEIVELLARIRAAVLFAEPGYGAGHARRRLFPRRPRLPFCRRLTTIPTRSSISPSLLAPPGPQRG
jgi:acyl-CoA synthetase